MRRPVLAIGGRPNVGKPTLSTRLVGRRRSLVHDVAGVTRDRLYGTVVFERWQATVVDTGGFEPQPTSDLVAGVRSQVMMAIDEADLIIFVVDGRTGLTLLDEEIAAVLRKSRHPVLVAVNKVDAGAQEIALAEWYRLGLSAGLALSAGAGGGAGRVLEGVPRAGP